MTRVASTSSSASSPSSASGSDSETSTKRELKRKFDTNSDSESESSGSSSSSDSDSDSDSGSSSKKPSSPKKSKKDVSSSDRKRKDQELEDGDAKEDDVDEDVQVLSHKDQRKLKKKQKHLASTDTDADAQNTVQKSKSNGAAKDEKPARKNSIWVGNLSFKTTPDVLRTFFTEAGEVTRVHMPTKAIHGTNIEGVKRGENRGFAYVDFATPEAKVIAITMSEKNLDGRKLLIKDGEDFTGRPAAAPTATTGVESGSTAVAGAGAVPGPSAGLSKTAQKILMRQKQPACPCLFLGNLGFETTEASVREMFERNARSRDKWAQKDKGERAKGKRRKGSGKDADLEGEETQDVGGDDGEDGEERKAATAGIRKVRLGTFEDSGNCKGFGFVDFTAAAQATAALINPYNHSLDGRSLVVEYASFDAARRGGYRPPNADGESNGRSTHRNTKTNGGRKFKDNRQNADSRIRANPSHSYSHSDSHTPTSTVEFGKVREDLGNGFENAHAPAPVLHGDDSRGYTKRKTETGEDGYGDGDLERPAKKANTTNANLSRGKAEGWANAKHRRAKPGAALAMAQREKVAIVPSTGKRMTFT